MADLRFFNGAKVADYHLIFGDLNFLRLAPAAVEFFMHFYRSNLLFGCALCLQRRVTGINLTLKEVILSLADCLEVAVWLRSPTAAL